MGPRILVVDDEPDILTSVRQSLEEGLGFPVEVVTAANGEEARRVLEEGPKFDMVLTDERMPGLRGVELLEWLRLVSPRTVRVLMTAFREPTLGQEAVNRAAAHLLLYKPFEFDDMMPRLRDALMAKARRDLQERSLESALRTFRRLSRGLDAP